MYHIRPIPGMTNNHTVSKSIFYSILLFKNHVSMTRHMMLNLTAKYYFLSNVSKINLKVLSINIFLYI